MVESLSMEQSARIVPIIGLLFFDTVCIVLRTVFVKSINSKGLDVFQQLLKSGVVLTTSGVMKYYRAFLNRASAYQHINSLVRQRGLYLLNPSISRNRFNVAVQSIREIADSSPCAREGVCAWFGDAHPRSRMRRLQVQGSYDGVGGRFVNLYVLPGLKFLDPAAFVGFVRVLETFLIITVISILLMDV